jgi:hypothetical protein
MIFFLELKKFLGKFCLVNLYGDREFEKFKIVHGAKILIRFFDFCKLNHIG